MLLYYTLGLVAGTPVELYRRLALGLFIAVAVTDALDRYLARSRNEIARWAASWIRWPTRPCCCPASFC